MQRHPTRNPTKRFDINYSIPIRSQKQWCQYQNKLWTQGSCRGLHVPSLKRAYYHDCATPEDMKTFIRHIPEDGPQINRIQEDAWRRHEPQDITTHTFTMTYCIIEERDKSKPDTICDINFSCKTPPSRVARAPTSRHGVLLQKLLLWRSRTQFVSRRKSFCRMLDDKRLNWYLSNWSIRLRLLISMNGGTRSRVWLGKSHDENPQTCFSFSWLGGPSPTMCRNGPKCRTRKWKKRERRKTAIARCRHYRKKRIQDKDPESE